MLKKWKIIAVSGITNGGKTTLVTCLKEAFPEIVVFSQDDYYRHEVHVIGYDPVLERVDGLPECYNWDVLSSIKIEKMFEDVTKFCSEHKDESGFIIIDGHLILNYKPLKEIVDKKYYLELDQEECRKRRNIRVYEPPDHPSYFDMCVWPMYLKHRQEVIHSIADVVYLDGSLSQEEIFHKVKTDLCVTLGSTFNRKY